MSVGSGNIRGYRVGSQGPEKGLKIKKGPTTPSQPKKTPTQVQLPRANGVPPKVIRPQQLGALRVELKLILDEKQKARLEALFLAPRALAELLRNYPQKLVSPIDASVFLLTNRKALDGFINPDIRERSVNLLSELLLQWSGNPPDSLGIDFDNVSLTPDQKVYLPLEGLRAIEVAEPVQLLQQRKGRHFKAPFTLFQEKKHFFIALTLELRSTGGHPASSSKQNGRDAKPREIQLKPGQPLPYISGMRNPPKEPRQRVLYSKYSGVFSGSLRTMNWEDLSGWGVNGGLPSLGKRSR